MAETKKYYLLVKEIPNWGGGDEPQIPNDEIWYTSSDGNAVEPVGADAFNANIVSNTYSAGKGVIKFDGDVTEIIRTEDGEAFGYTKLTSIIIPNSVTHIDSDPFTGCEKLSSIIVGSKNTVYDSRDNCNAIIETESNTLICGCKNTIIPNNVTSIDYMAFAYSTGMTSITVPNSVTTIGDWAFSGCTGITSVTIGNSVTTIGEYAFNECTGLTSVTIPNSVMSIKKGAFRGCTGITSITIPNSVTSIGSGAFDNTPWYNNQPDGVVYINNVLYKYKGTMPSNSSGVLREGIITITTGAFANCTGLTSITIPNSVTEIGGSVFSGCTGLKSITIPNSVTSIGTWTFSGCTSLTSVKVEATTPQTISKNVFNKCTKLTEILVPSDSVNAYKTASGWSDYASKIKGF